jgi:uncharacterized protein (DUF927 family)
VDLYRYENNAGKPVIYVKRIEQKNGKRFCQWGPSNDMQGWQANLRHAPKPRPLYRLPVIKAAISQTVVFHEGEKATEAAIRAGLPGIHTTTLGGARNARQSDFTALRGMDVVVCPDNDEDGERYARDVEKLAHQAGAKSVRIAGLPDVPVKGDIVEWLDAGGTAQQFSEILRNAPPSIITGLSGPSGPAPTAEASECLALSVDASGPLNPDLVHFLPVPGYRIAPEGVFELLSDGTKPEVRLTSAPCGVVALCRDGRRENWGAYLRWIDRDGVVHKAAYPVGRFHEVGGSLPGELANRGLPIVPGMEKRVLRYFANCNPATRFRAAIQTGWQEGTSVFVLPLQSIGERGHDERIVYQPERFSPTAYSVRQEGLLVEWQKEVAARCEGNPVLMFWAAASFAAPLLALLGQEGGGFHLYGQTSKGKTTAEQVAASVWGDGSDPASGRITAYTRKWNQTKNATEGLAEAHTDLPLCLDEVGEADAKEFGRMVYQLAGGQGKGRMRADAALAAPKTWRILLLSTGELPTLDIIEAQGRAIKGGQAVRLIDIPATDPVTGQDIIAQTHGAANSATFVEALKRECGTVYGVAGPAFLEALHGRGLQNIQGQLHASMQETVQALTLGHASPEVQRAAKRFALVAVAGGLAVDLGILPWQQRGVYGAVSSLFRRFITARGGAGSDTERAVDRLRNFILTHGAGRFRDFDCETDRIQNLVGYRNRTEGIFYFTSDGFKEACDGHDIQDVARLLRARGVLRAPDGGHLTERVTIPGVGRTRLYTVLADILDGVAEVPDHWTTLPLESVRQTSGGSAVLEGVGTYGPLGPAQNTTASGVC